MSINTLIYVDSELIISAAARLLGSEIEIGRQTEGSLSFNWFISSSLNETHHKTSRTNIVDMFGEDIVSLCYRKIEKTCIPINEFCNNASSGKIKPPTVCSISGILKLDSVTEELNYNPYSPTKSLIDESLIFKIYGRECFCARVENDGFSLPVYFYAESSNFVTYANNMPVEVIGVVKWSPTYEISGYAMNNIFVGIALLLRK